MLSQCVLSGGQAHPGWRTLWQIILLFSLGVRLPSKKPEQSEEDERDLG